MKVRCQPLETRRLLAAGDPDLTFGGDGIIDDSFAANMNVNDIDMTSDDKIVVAGGVAPTQSGEFDYMLRRYNPDGTFDTTFGQNGTASGRFHGVSTRLYRMHLAPDGKIVALAMNDSVNNEVIIARFNVDGSLDSTFSDDGLTVQAIPDSVIDVSVDNDGRVIVQVGDTVTRYTANGSLDTTFGTGGTISGILESSVQTLEPLSDGSLLIAGAELQPDGIPSQFAIKKFNEDGSADTSFGANGTVVTDIDNTPDIVESVYDLAVLSDGKFLAFGHVDFKQLTIVCYNADGSVDTTFGDQGIASTLMSGSSSRIFVDDDGRIYATTHGGGIARFTSDGALDPAFGRVTLGAPDGFLSILAGVTSTARIISGGQSNDFPPTLRLVSRLAEDDGNPSPITLSGGTLSIIGTSGNDYVHVTDFYYVDATLNKFGRTFDTGDVDLISIVGGAGKDVLRIDQVRDIPAHVSGGPGVDKISGGEQGDTLLGNAGRDFIHGGLGPDLIVGNKGNDQMHGEGGKDRIYGREGNDYFEGDGGDDRLVGGPGEDRLNGDGGNDTLFANDSNIDFLNGYGGNDTAFLDDEDFRTSIEVLL